MTTKKYVVQYDTNMYQLEKFISDSLYLVNCQFFSNDQFFDFSVGSYKQSLEQLLKTLDDVMYNLNEIGPKICNTQIHQYQSKVEYALKDIRSKINNYVYSDVLNTIKPNKTTLYKETYELLVNISQSLIDVKTYLTIIDNNVDVYRDYSNNNVDLTELKELKTKNRLRILFTYLYTSSYISSYDDYTGLHTDPDNPVYISLNDGIFNVYELSLEILKSTKEFTDKYFEFKDVLDKIDNKIIDEQLINIDENILHYAKLLHSPIKSISKYYNIRNHFKDDFYTSGEFKKYQKYTKSIVMHMNFREKISIYDFDETREDYNFKLMKESYYDVKSFTYLDKYYNLMFSQEELNMIALLEF